MSIEKLIADQTAALEANTSAVKELTAVWLQLRARAGSVALDETAEVTAGGVKLEGARAAKPEAKEQSTNSQTLPPASKMVDTAPPADDVGFAEVRELVISLSRTHRDQIKAINAQHGIAKLSVLLTDENDFGSVNDRAKLNAVYADLLALEV
jgi:hypothetical protein